MISLDFKRKLIGYTNSLGGQSIYIIPATEEETRVYLENYQEENFVLFREFKKKKPDFNGKSYRNRVYGEIKINEQLNIMLLSAKKTDFFRGKSNEDIFMFLLNQFNYKKIMNANSEKENERFKKTLEELKKTIENLLKLI